MSNEVKGFMRETEHPYQAFITNRHERERGTLCTVGFPLAPLRAEKFKPIPSQE
jgi:hypothetical protein